jgi:hypothetical protein
MSGIVCKDWFGVTKNVTAIKTVNAHFILIDAKYMSIDNNGVVRGLNDIAYVAFPLKVNTNGSTVYYQFTFFIDGSPALNSTLFMLSEFGKATVTSVSSEGFQLTFECFDSSKGSITSTYITEGKCYFLFKKLTDSNGNESWTFTISGENSIALDGPPLYQQIELGRSLIPTGVGFKLNETEIFTRNGMCKSTKNEKLITDILFGYRNSSWGYAPVFYRKPGKSVNFVGMPYYTSSFYYVSDDGVNWRNMPLPFYIGGNWQGVSVAYGNGKYVMTLNNSIWCSTDGLSWTKCSYSSDTQTNFCYPYGVVYTNGTFACLNGVEGRDLYTLITSTDGVTWTGRTISVLAPVYGYSNNTNLKLVTFSGRFHILSFNTDSTAELFWSSDALTWKSKVFSEKLIGINPAAANSAKVLLMSTTRRFAFDTSTLGESSSLTLSHSYTRTSNFMFGIASFSTNSTNVELVVSSNEVVDVYGSYYTSKYFSFSGEITGMLGAITGTSSSDMINLFYGPDGIWGAINNEHSLAKLENSVSISQMATSLESNLNRI